MLGLNWGGVGRVDRRWLVVLLVSTLALMCIGLSVIQAAGQGRAYWPGLGIRQAGWLLLGASLATLCAFTPAALLRNATLPVSAGLVLLAWGSVGIHSTSLRTLPLLLLALIWVISALVAGASRLRQRLLWLVLCGASLALLSTRPSPLVATALAAGIALAIGARTRWSIRGWVAASLVLISAWFYALRMPSYQLARLRAWLAPDVDRLGAGYMLNHNRQLASEGGVWGAARAWPGSTPEAVMEAPFVIWTHQHGLVGAALLVGLYACLVGAACHVALRATQPFYRAIAQGVAAFWGLHLLCSAGGNLGLVPATSVTLPLIGYGGSGAVAALVSVGLLLHALLRLEGSNQGQRRA